MTREDIFRNHLESACTECGFTDDALVAYMMKAYNAYVSKDRIKFPNADAIKFGIECLREQKSAYEAEDDAELLYGNAIHMLQEAIDFLKVVTK